MELRVYNYNGQESGKSVVLEDKVFQIEPNNDAMHSDVRLILANARQGTHKTKERGEVSGTTRKPYRQKGTGNARAGHMRSPLMRHGGTIFGPRPRDYGFKLNKKVKRLARRSALTYKLRENQITVIENIPLAQPRTKTVLDVIKAFKWQKKRLLFVTDQVNLNLYHSARNIEKVSVTPAALLNTYDILKAETLVFLKDAVETVNKQLG